MAYNIYFNNKRKCIKIKQTNSSATIQQINNENTPQILPSKVVFEEARKTGVLALVNFHLNEIPQEIYFINVANYQRSGHPGFVDDDNRSWWEDILLRKLDLSFNKIRSIDPNIKLLNNLSHLDLQNNRIESLPDEIVEMDKLKYLNLSNNKICVLPDVIGSLFLLQSLYLRNNNICSIPRVFCRLTSLEVLDISNNRLAYLPEIIGFFIRLKTLLLASNSIKLLPDVVAKLKGLTVLDLSRNKLSTFPNNFEATFEILKLDVNKLITFPIYRFIPSLKELYIGYNNITDFSEKIISFIPNITVLSMPHNNIREIPQGIDQLKTIFQLDVSHNCLDSIPCELGYLEALEHLNLDGNVFRSIKRSAITGGTEVLKRYLRTRNSKREEMNNHSSRNLVNIVPQNNSNTTFNTSEYNAHEFNSSGIVNLSNRNLDKIPERCFVSLKARKIKGFCIAYNKLQEIPQGIFWFAHNLVVLDISYNLMIELPDTFNNFTCIEDLDLSGNYLTSLPKSFEHMRHTLISLNLAHNPLGLEIPVVVYQLESLQSLNLSNCLINNIIPEEFMKLKKLTKLDISNNAIETIPPGLGLCENIKVLNLNGNKIREHSPKILKQDTNLLFQYLGSKELQN